MVNFQCLFLIMAITSVQRSCLIYSDCFNSDKGCSSILLPKAAIRGGDTALGFCICINSMFPFSDLQTVSVWVKVTVGASCWREEGTLYHLPVQYQRRQEWCCRRTWEAPQQEATNSAESYRRGGTCVDAQEEVQPQYLSSAWPWRTAAQEQSYSAFAKKDLSVLVKSRKLAHPNACWLLGSSNPSGLQPGGRLGAMSPWSDPAVPERELAAWEWS